MRIVVYGQDPLPEFSNPVITIGAFDGLHLAHRQILKRVTTTARQLKSDSVLITFNPHPRTIIDSDAESLNLLCSIEEKIRLLEESDLDYLVLVPFNYTFSMMLPEDYIENFIMAKFHPKKIIVGFNHRFGKDGQGDSLLLKRYALKYNFEFEEVIPQHQDQTIISSSHIRKLINNQQLEKANLLLGNPYLIMGKVIPGKRIGRKLGFPTANLEIADKYKLVPPGGVYAAFCTFNGTLYEGMVYISKMAKPLNHPQRIIEINLFDFTEDIYGRTIGIYLVDFIRPDLNFEIEEKLIAQIRKDKIHIQNVLQKYKIHFRPIQNPLTAIVILNYNGINFLKTYLPSLIHHKPVDMPVYIIDNNSADNSCIFLEHHYPDIKLIRLKKNYGFAGGYNKGLAQIKADYFVLLNSDVQIEDDWISEIILKMQENPEILAAQPKILDLNRKNAFEYAGAAGGYLDFLGYPFCRGRIIDYLEDDQAQYNNETEIFWATGAAMVIKAEAFNALGGFDTDYFAHQEEIDLCWRIKRIGGKVMCFPSSAIYHLGGGTLDYTNPRKTYLNFRNNLFTIFKNTKWISLLIILPVRLVLDVLIALSYLLKGQYKVCYKIIQAYVISIINTIYLIHKKNYNNQLIKKLKLRKENNKGLLNASIFLQYYFSGNKHFSDIPDQYFSKS